jgi:hypothetical protein
VEFLQVVDDANDFEIGVVRRLGNFVEDIELDLMTNGIVVAEVGFDEGGVDDSDAAGIGNVGGRKESATEQVQTHGREVVFIHSIKCGDPVFVVRLARNGDVASARPAEHRKSNGDGGMGDAGKRGSARESLIEESTLGFKGVVLVTGKMHAGTNDSLGANAGIELGDGQKAADHESCIDEQEHGESDLADDEASANARAAWRSIDAEAGGLQVGAKILFDGEESGRKAEEQSGEQGKKNGKNEHG